MHSQALEDTDLRKEQGKDYYNPSLKQMTFEKEQVIGNAGS